jgi:hypothetical protein
VVPEVKKRMLGVSEARARVASRVYCVTGGRVVGSADWLSIARDVMLRPSATISRARECSSGPMRRTCAAQWRIMWEISVGRAPIALVFSVGLAV